MKDMMSDMKYSNMQEMLNDCLSEVNARIEKTGFSGISSGFKPLDDLTGGFEKGKVYVIGGRPGMGKEELMLSMIKDIVLKSKLPVLLFSTNYKKSDYVERLLSSHCDIPTTHLHKGLMKDYEWIRLDKGVHALEKAPLFIHDSLDLPLNELTEIACICIKEKGIKVIFIDFLQMIDFAKEDGNISERIAKVMGSLKQLACLFNIPIIAGSMLNRGVEWRDGIEGKQPQFVDLANSSYIEELADVVMMVYRPEYYRIYLDEQCRDLHGMMEVFVRKNNLKPLGSIRLAYHQKTGFVSLMKDSLDSSSKPVSLKKMSTDNKAIKSLMEAFDLEEDLPF